MADTEYDFGTEMRGYKKDEVDRALQQLRSELIKANTDRAEAAKEVARLLAVEKISIIITVDKETGRIAHIAATLRQPIRVLLGLARITDLDLDVGVEPADEDPARPPGEIIAGSKAHVALSKLGSPLDYHWSDFKRVTSYRTP